MTSELTLDKKLPESFRQILEGMDGWCTWEKAQALYDLVLRCNSEITIELGVYAGRSFIPMALAHKEKQSGFVLGFDAYRGKVCTEGSNSPANDEWWTKKVNLDKIYRVCLDAIDNNDISEWGSVVRMRSQDAAKAIRDECADIIHQDSNHNPETILEEAKLWTPKLKPGGYWIADDTDWKEAAAAYAQLSEFGLELVENFISWQIWRKVK